MSREPGIWELREQNSKKSRKATNHEVQTLHKI